MTRKLIALVEVLMVISIISTGYASWSYFRPHTLDASTNTIVSYEVEAQNLESYGVFPLSNTEASAQGLSTQTFRYITQNGAQALTSNTLSMWFRITPSSMIGEDKVHDAVVMHLTCTAKSGATPIYFVNTTDADGNDVSGINYWLQYPARARLVVKGFENRTLQATVKEQDGNLVMEFPLTEIYQMLSACEGRETFFVELCLDFTQTSDTYSSDTPLSWACAYTYSFSAVLRPKS
ncbi:MAG: hypothetical protein IJW30_05865 [Clostridia bacterium]|nr:hypothetical protein [Clostridia bacterium]